MNTRDGRAGYSPSSGQLPMQDGAQASQAAWEEGCRRKEEKKKARRRVGERRVGWRAKIKEATGVVFKLCFQHLSLDLSKFLL